MDPTTFNPEDVMHQIVITMTRQGQVQFSLPNDVLTCYGLLEAAKDAVREQAKIRMQEAHQAIAIASALPTRNGSGPRRV